MQLSYRHCIFVGLVLSVFQSSLAAGTFQTPSTNSDERIKEIQNDLLKVKNDITDLNVALSSGDTSQDLKARLSTLETQFESLKKQLLDESQKSSSASGKHSSLIEELNNLYNQLDTQLKSLQDSMEKKKEEEATQRLPERVGTEIRSRRYKEAETLLLELNEKNEFGRLPSIIHDVYANSPGNTDLILDFAKSLSSIQLTAFVLHALWLEMKTNNNRDPYQLIDLGRATVLDVLIQPNAPNDAKLRALQIVQLTFLTVTDVATEKLKAAVYRDNYVKNVDVEKLANAISNFSPQVSDAVMERLVNETYPAVEPDKIADAMYSNKYISQIVSGLVALFRKLDSVGSLNDKAVLKIGYYLKRLMAMGNYAHIDEAKKAAVQGVIEKMPICAKNLFFASSVCIWNRATSEYLYVAGSKYDWNRDRRSIFSTYGKQGSSSVWYPRRYDDDEHLYFESKAYSNEFMYAAGVDPYDKENRYVLTWKDGGGGIVENKAAWTVELFGDYCFLQNKNYREHLYASDEMQGGSRRYPFTWMPQTSHRQTKFQWQIRNCD